MMNGHSCMESIYYGSSAGHEVVKEKSVVTENKIKEKNEDPAKVIQCSITKHSGIDLPVKVIDEKSLIANETDKGNERKIRLMNDEKSKRT